MLAGENGDLLYFENFEFRALLTGPPGSKTEATETSSLVAFSKGFVAGGVEGSLRVFREVGRPAGPLRVPARLFRQ